MSILKNALKEQEKSFYLKSTTYLMCIKEKLFREELTALYNSEDLSLRAMATILNGIYTDGKQTFFLSFRSFEKLLIKDDINLNYKGRSGIKKEKRKHVYKLIYTMFNNIGFAIEAMYSKEHKTPACITLVDDETLTNMGTTMAIKMAKNWRQSAINCLSTIHQTSIKVPSNTDQTLIKLLSNTVQDDETTDESGKLGPRLCSTSIPTLTSTRESSVGVVVEEEFQEEELNLNDFIPEDDDSLATI